MQAYRPSSVPELELVSKRVSIDGQTHPIELKPRISQNSEIAVDDGSQLKLLSGKATL